MIKFIVDAHFPNRLSTWLRTNGYDSIHTSDLPKGNETPDLEVIQLASEENRTIITKDSDFSKYRAIKGIPEQIIMVTTGNIVNKVLIQLFEDNISDIIQLINDGKKVIEINNHSIIVHE